MAIVIKMVMVRALCVLCGCFVRLVSNTNPTPNQIKRVNYARHRREIRSTERKPVAADEDEPEGEEGAGGAGGILDVEESKEEREAEERYQKQLKQWVEKLEGDDNA